MATGDERAGGGNGSGVISRWNRRSRRSLLAVPAMFVFGALVLSVITVVADEMLSGVVPGAILFRGDEDSARTILSSIASAAITLTGLVFSVTMLVLQLTGSQYSPRTMGALLTDRTAKYTLGVFVATFTYSLAILRTIDPQPDKFERGISVAVAVLMALVTVGFFVQFVNHIVQQIRPSSIIGRVARSAEQAIDAYLLDDDEQFVSAPAQTTDPSHVVPAPKGGVVQTIDIRALVAAANEQDLRLRVIPGVGEFVPEGGPLIHVWRSGRTVDDDADDTERHEGSEEAEQDEDRDDAQKREASTDTSNGGSDANGDGSSDDDDGDDDEHHDDLAGHVLIGDERSLEADPMFGLRQLVDIAERALSPGVNDPTTAVQSIDQIHNLLRRIVDRSLPNGVHADDDGKVRLIVSEPQWQDMFDLALDEIVHYGHDSIQVKARVETMLDDLVVAAPPHRILSIENKRDDVRRRFD